ncbi:MAG: hypothetical protein N2047_10395 [Meiothermus sp.]|nr:hypothetical protein [Meiothermus sp.]
MRSFRLDQPNYVIFNITWYDLMGGGTLGGLVGFGLNAAFSNPALTLVGMGLGFGLYYVGLRFYQRILPYDSGAQMLAWYLSQQNFYEHRPDTVVIPLVVKSNEKTR